MSDGPTTPVEVRPQIHTEPKEVYTPDLIQAITEARRFNRVNPENPKTTESLMRGGLETAERLVTEYAEYGEDGKKDALFWPLESAVRGNIANVGDFLELSRTKPDIAGSISPQKMYALLSLVHERQIPFTDFYLEMLRNSGRELPEDKMNLNLDRRNLLKTQAEDFRKKAGEPAYKEIMDLANSPKFDRFRPKMGFALNPEFTKAK